MQSPAISPTLLSTMPPELQEFIREGEHQIQKSQDDLEKFKGRIRQNHMICPSEETPHPAPALHSPPPTPMTRSVFEMVAANADQISEACTEATQLAGQVGNELQRVAALLQNATHEPNKATYIERLDQTLQSVYELPLHTKNVHERALLKFTLATRMLRLEDGDPRVQAAKAAFQRSHEIWGRLQAVKLSREYNANDNMGFFQNQLEPLVREMNEVAPMFMGITLTPEAIAKSSSSSSATATMTQFEETPHPAEQIESNCKKARMIEQIEGHREAIREGEREVKKSRDALEEYKRDSARRLEQGRLEEEKRSQQASMERERILQGIRDRDREFQRNWNNRPQPQPNINPPPVLEDRGYIHEARFCISLLVFDAVTRWRNAQLANGQPSCTRRLFVLFAAEVAYVFNISLALIEFVVRGALAVFIVLPLKLCGLLEPDHYSLKDRFLKGAAVVLIGGVGYSLHHALYNLNPHAPLFAR